MSIKQDSKQSRNGIPHECTPLLDERSAIEHSRHATKDPTSVEEAVNDASTESSEEGEQNPKANVIFIALLLGCFLANAVGAVVLATNQYIASEFDALSSAAWLLTIYTLAQCASQPLYGKLADIFGARQTLAFCWLTFIAGDIIVAFAQTYWQALLGRSVSGIGSSGMISLASVIITALVPVREVATYRAYINVAATAARASGGPIGAWISGNVSWRWCFIAPCPITLSGLIFILWKLPNPDVEKAEEVTTKTQIARVDFYGAAALVGFVLSFLLLLDRATKQAPNGLIAGLAASTAVCLAVFIFVESKVAQEPILPIGLLANRDVFIPYLIVGCKSAGQFTLLYSIPLYFIIIQGEGVAAAGTRIVPVVVGNAVGTVLSGQLIGKSRQYKTLTLAAIGVALAGWVLILVRWNGPLNLIESLYVLLPGFGMGTIQSSTFIHVAASLDRKDMSIAGTVWFLAQSFGYLIGASFATALINAMLRSYLGQGLEGFAEKDEIVRGIMKNIDSVQNLPHVVQIIVAQSYANSLHWAHALSVTFLTLAFVMTLLLKEKKLD